MNYFSECKEIVPGLILGSVSDVEQMVEMGADVLVPLAYLESSVWNTDFRGEILYCPIKDRGVLPLDVLDTMVLKILIRLDKKKKVALFCAGGHGRTGYLAACVLAAQGIKDPIGYLRKEYSPHAVETDAQAEAILTYMEKLKAEDRKDIDKDKDIEYGDDIPYLGDDVKYDTPEEGMAALMEDVQRLGLMLDSEFYGDAEEDLRWIIDGLNSGRYNVYEETVKQLLEALEVRFRF